MKQLKDIIKIAAFDVDGTLLPNGHTKFEENTKKMFSQLKNNGIKTVVASAREFATIGDFLDQLHPVDYFIGANGSFIWDVQKRDFIFKASIDKEVVKKIFNKFKDEQVAMAVTDFDRVYKSPNLKTDTWFIKPFMQNYHDYEDASLRETDLYLITFSTDDPKNLSDKVEQYIKKNDFNVEVSSRWSRGFWISPKNVTKSHTLEILCKHLGYSMENLIAFGDSSNDYEMLRDAHYGVAMQRANDKLKSVAKDVALDCEYEGCYLKLKELHLI
ncbi:haloacid dehalogenase [Mycoplasmopsis canis]|uniref:YcsE-related riboflavin metabolism phosphatase n=1 Tax=Mycoplasmopsis canis TaxID=29555 RepID=UPI00062484E7|nr:HAD family hydrolase [Mycoplasmopsis canis]AKF41315.1 haloacid dehalogenase [Mycoplasmopsis canis]